MPKNSSAPKKARWTTAQKAQARKGPTTGGKKPFHRGQAPRPVAGEGGSPRTRSTAGGRPERRERPERFERGDRSDRYERSERNDRGDRYERGDRNDRYERSDRPARGERPERGERREFGGRPQGSSRFERGDRNDRYERSDRNDRYERSGRPARGERPERGERREFGGRSQGSSRFERRERTDRYERSDRTDRYERSERRESWDRPRSHRPERRDWPERGPRVADPVRRDRHEGRHAVPPRTFEEAEAERAEADTWTAYRSTGKGGPAAVTADNGFAALGLPEVVVERLARDGITEPFPIQAATIPDALGGRDVLGRGRTGSGKTLAFGLPTIARLLSVPRARTSRRPRVLILVPTRELAMQVSDALEPFIHVAGLRHKLVAGGLSYEPQIKALDKGIDLLIATPGRLADLMERGAVLLDNVEIAILDEADHMADMGFLPEVTAILDAVPAGGQRLLFSATLDRGIDTLVERYLSDPVAHEVDDAQAAVTTMSHHVLLIDPQDKKALTAQLAGRPGRVIIFARTQLGADRIAGELRDRGVLAAALHGGLSQAVRNRVLGAFRDNSIPVLVATDVAARGIHVDDIGLVLQVDPPRDHKDYLHRAGRTARAGEEGMVVMLALPHQKKMVTRLIEASGAEAQIARVSAGDATVLGLGGQPYSGTPVPEAPVRGRSRHRAGGPGSGGGRRPMRPRRDREGDRPREWRGRMDG
jgi:superfamily II DNA/RNA helicase